MAIAVVLGEQPIVVHHVQRGYLVVGVVEYPRLFAGHFHIVDGDGDARLGGVSEAQVLDVVQDFGSFVAAQQFVRLRCDVFEDALVDDGVVEAQLRRQGIVEYDAAGRGFHPSVRIALDVGGFAVAVGGHAVAHLDRRSQVDLVQLIRQPRVVDACEPLAVAARVFARLRHIEAPQHHIKRGRYDGFA